VSETRPKLRPPPLPSYPERLMTHKPMHRPVIQSTHSEVESQGVYYLLNGSLASTKKGRFEFLKTQKSKVPQVQLVRPEVQPTSHHYLYQSEIYFGKRHLRIFYMHTETSPTLPPPSQTILTCKPTSPAYWYEPSSRGDDDPR
jgi:hypothetical protein